jgi:hypothetical protein
MKTCSKCKLLLPINKFSKGTNLGGLSSYCKDCSHEYYKNRYKRKKKIMHKTQTHKQCRFCENILPINQFHKKDKRNNKTETYCKECRSYLGHERVLHRYKMTIDQYITMLKEQNYQCKICEGTENKRLSVDHDHNCCPGQTTCGKCTRGLLCSYCNKTLGLAKDNEQILQKMIDYLKQYK